MTVTYTYTDIIPQIQDRVAPQKGALKMNMVDLTCDASYPAGGYPLTATNLGLTSLITVIVLSQGLGGVCWMWDNTTNKLKGWKGAATSIPFTEIANSDISVATIVRLLAIGR
jgi:hypothetical protein